MKLYVLDMKVVNRRGGDSIEDEKKERYVYGMIKTIGKFELTISADDPWDDEGEWSTTHAVPNFLDQASGYWKTVKRDGDIFIPLMNVEEVNFISYFWRDAPEWLGEIEGILKLPLSLGETGTGSVTGNGKMNYISWKVAQRTF